MKVTIYKLEDGGFSVLLQAAPGKGRAPVLVQNVTKSDIKGAILPLIVAVRRPRGAPLEP